MSNNPNSSTSSDEIFDYMLLDFIEGNRQQQIIEDALRYVVNTTMKQQQQDVPRQRKRREVIPRNREAAHDQLVVDYFSDQPLYGDDKFRRRFRMRKPLFMKIVNQLSETDQFFQQHLNASLR
ncbi:uncharacterized protein LOC110687255 [Chenopodium quinoa]|uniref:uncharacterized protein LOC110687255 n=1 Tax=Chenopodium quinoa TaxID=63459 RepID=UPI000B79AF50|nr:uncharacterized protein LOC110687255 [Chenopodium quinoa]